MPVHFPPNGPLGLGLGKCRELLLPSEPTSVVQPLNRTLEQLTGAKLDDRFACADRTSYAALWGFQRDRRRAGCLVTKPPS